jgi:hypothetical protein
MNEQRETGIKVYFRRGNINIEANISVRSEKAWVIFLLTIYIILILASAMNDEILRLLLELVIGLLQITMLNRQDRY